MTAIALIPARSGSVRIPSKNVRVLAGHPLLSYTIAAARRSGAFARVIVSTDSSETAEIAREYGAEVPWLRPAELAGNSSRDIEWVHDALQRELLLHDEGVFSLLRPTSPLRRPASIRAAVSQLLADPAADSLRAVELCRQHPGKMWVLEDSERMSPLLSQPEDGQPWHSTPYQSLPTVYVQNAALEVAWMRTVRDTGTIAGSVVRPFILEGHEGLDLNDEADWRMLQMLLDDGEVDLASPHPDHDATEDV